MYRLDIRVIAILLFPLYQLFSSALPRKIVGTLGTIKMLLRSYPVNKCILITRFCLGTDTTMWQC